MHDKLLADAALRGARYLEELAARPVYPRPDAIGRLRAALQAPLPDRPSSPEEVLKFIDEQGSQATVASAGGRYFGFVTGGALPAAVAAHQLATSWDQNAVTFTCSPAGTLFEQAALRWLCQALMLPESTDGTLTTGATMASFACLAAARHEVLHQAGWDVEGRGLIGAPPIQLVASEEVHGTVLKVLGMLGLGRDALVRVATDSQGRMIAAGMPTLRAPAIVIVQGGNVNSGSFDPAAEIIPRAHAAGAWVHVDGAFGLWARGSPKRAALAAGFEDADSWATDAHKWLNVPYDCGIALVRREGLLRAALSASGSYLMLGEHRDGIDVSPDSSRRARGVDVWAALRQLGRAGIAELVERNCEQAAWLAAGLRKAGIEVLNEVVLNQVVVAFGSDERTKEVISSIQKAGEIWCGGTRWKGREAMRVSISSWATTQRDMEIALQAIVAAAR
jgi:glutamate/tyrosine decarboxylase-like PLP-dependent enzyme